MDVPVCRPTASDGPVMAADPSLHMMQVDFEDFLALTLTLTTLVRGVGTK